MSNQNKKVKALQKLAAGTVIPAHPLALDKNKKLVEKYQRALSRYYLAAGAGGLAVGVHTTQFEIRKPDIGLFEPVLRIVSEEIKEFEKKEKKTIIKIAGVCGPVKQAVKEAEIARDLGYDVVLLSPGGLDDLTEKEMIARTRRVANILPVMGFYLQTAVGGRKFSNDYWAKICELKNLVAIKCAPFNRYQTIDVVRAVAFSSRSEEIALYTGNDDSIIIDLLTQFKFRKNGQIYQKEFVGGLLGQWAVWTRRAVEMFKELKTVSENGKKENMVDENIIGKNIIPSEYIALAVQLTDANAAIFDAANNFKGCIAGIHEVLHRQGLLPGIWCLEDEEVLSSGQKEEIDRVYEMYPDLNDDRFVIENRALFFVGANNC